MDGAVDGVWTVPWTVECGILSWTVDLFLCRAMGYTVHRLSNTLVDGALELVSIDSTRDYMLWTVKRTAWLGFDT